MHSSRMGTGRTLTIFRSLLFLGGGGWCTSLVLGGVSGPGGCTCLVPGVYLPGPGGCTCLVWGGCTCLVPGVYLAGPGGCVWSRGVYLPGLGRSVPAWSQGVYLPGLGGCTCLVWGVPAWSGGGAWSGTPPPCGQNDTHL